MGAPSAASAATVPRAHLPSPAVHAFPEPPEFGARAHATSIPVVSHEISAFAPRPSERCAENSPGQLYSIPPDTAWDGEPHNGKSSLPFPTTPRFALTPAVGLAPDFWLPAWKETYLQSRKNTSGWTHLIIDKVYRKRPGFLVSSAMRMQ